MSQSAALIDTLKRCLRAERKTYADVARALSLSEASVKRLFAGRDVSLERVETICRMIDMDLGDLVRRMEEGSRRLESLTAAQEREITEDLALLVVTVCAFNHWTLEQILRFYRFTEEECLAKLLRLDQMKLIDLLPGNRIKLRISPNFTWRDGGPIQSFFRRTVGREFFDIDFGGDGECLLVLNGMLSRASHAEFRRRLARVAAEFNELNDADRALPFDQRHGTTLVMAMRHWEFGLFQHLMRKSG